MNANLATSETHRTSTCVVLMGRSGAADAQLCPVPPGFWLQTQEMPVRGQRTKFARIFATAGTCGWACMFVTLMASFEEADA